MHRPWRKRCFAVVVVYATDATVAVCKLCVCMQCTCARYHEQPYAHLRVHVYRNMCVWCACLSAYSAVRLLGKYMLAAYSRMFCTRHRRSSWLSLCVCIVCTLSVLRVRLVWTLAYSERTGTRADIVEWQKEATLYKFMLIFASLPLSLCVSAPRELNW